MMLEMKKPELCLSNRRMKIRAKQRKATGEGALCKKLNKQA